MSYIKSLTTEMNGKHITCKIENTVISDARIVLEEGQYFIVQNHRNGYDCIDKLGYKYSWAVNDGSTDNLVSNGIAEIQLIETNYEIY